MAEFLSTRGVSLKLEEIIKNAKTKLFIVTPYLKLSQPIYEQLKRVSGNVDFNIIYGKTDLYPVEDKLLKELNCSIYFKDNLHAKCYLNEQFALVSSMNLHSFSEVHNYEMGVILNSEYDKEAYYNCLQEIELIQSNASQIKVQRQKEFEINSEIKNEHPRDEFRKTWEQTVMKMVPSNKIEVVDGCLSVSDFPVPNITLDMSYGIASFKINLPFEKCKHYKSLYGVLFFLPNYRVYWNGSFRKIQLYWRKNIEFNTIDEEIAYCKVGLQEMLRVLEKCNFE